MLDRLEASRAALDESVRAQRQLVADASHELRTPVTSLRTNIEVLLAGAELDRRGPPPAARRRGRAERGAERARRRPDRAGARRPASRGRAEDVRLDRRRRGVARPLRVATRPDVRFDDDARARDGRGRPRAPRARDQQPARQRRPPLSAGRRRSRCSVDRDGVARARPRRPGSIRADLPHVFDRFFRGANARGRQGSGLGSRDRPPGRRAARRLRSVPRTRRRRRDLHIRLPTVPDAETPPVLWSAAAEEQAGPATAGDRR